MPFVFVAPQALYDMLCGAPAQGLSNWVFALAYRSFAAWGVALAAATRQYSRTTGRACVAVPAGDRCGDAAGYPR